MVHICACGLLYLGLKQPHTVDSRSVTQRFAVRIMELHKPEPKLQRPVEHVLVDPGQQPSTHQVAPGASQETAAAQRIPLNFTPQKQAHQTLIQPEAPPDLTIPQEVPLPQVVMWSSRDITVKKIVQPTAPSVAAINVRPSLDPPNQEVRIADLKISSTPFETKAPVLPPSKTSPVVVKGPEPTQQIPETASKGSGKPTPASIISLSNVQLQEGNAVLPMINEVAPTPFSGSLTPGQPKSQSPVGHGNAEGKQNNGGTGHTTGDQPGKAAVAASGSGGEGGATGQGGVEASVTTGASQPTVVHITQPKDGKFGVVVVGSSVAEDYPETLNLWRGRLAYTVYLHVGVARNWILQYSLPRSQTVQTDTRPDAPWPYDMTRPSIDADSNADAIMVHGFVNAAGHFEQLAIIFPAELAEAKFLIHTLQQWQFRPAMQNGQATPVEILIIIPDQTE
jgi:hypothetical protein